MVRRESTIGIIPAKNEAAFIADVVRRTRRHVSRLIVVDDGSSDSTAVEAAAVGAEVIVREGTPGKGEAIKTGLRAVLPDLSWHHVLVLDGDGQHIPDEIPRLLTTAQTTGAGLVIGNRMSRPTGMPWLRRSVNRWVSREICQLCEQSIPDTQCGFRLFRRDLLPLLLCETTGFDYETEVILLIARAGVRIETVPVTCRYGAERSKINPIRDTIRYFSLMHRYRRSKRTEWGTEPEPPAQVGYEN